MLQNYELVMIFKPEFSEDEVTSTMERIGRTVTKDKGSIDERKDWGVRPLSYPIQWFTEGNYVLANMTMEAKTAIKVEKSMTGAQEVLRYLLVKKD